MQSHDDGDVVDESNNYLSVSKNKTKLLWNLFIILFFFLNLIESLQSVFSKHKT